MSSHSVSKAHCDKMKIAITGGIGSGKSYVCRLLAQRGIQIYDCDAGAKRLMHSSEDLKKQLTELIGPDTYQDGKLNKVVVAQFLLASEGNKQAINHIVHPAVIKDFYSSGMDWMECAILYDAHLEDTVDRVVCVTAPQSVRTERIMQRDGITREKATEWINAQISQDEAESRADYVIINDGITSLDEQIDALLKRINI